VHLSLKGCGLSISDDLTPTARAKKKLLLKSAAQTRNLNYDVKIKNDYLLINGTRYGISVLKNSNWVNKLNDSQQVDNNAEGRQPRKRARQSSPSNDVDMQPSFSSNTNNTEQVSSFTASIATPPKKTGRSPFERRRASVCKQDRGRTRAVLAIQF
jgi:hypothetical protein